MSHPTVYDFAGKTALITGAASGFGAAIARRFSAAGARIVAADRDRSRLEREAAAWPAAAGGPPVLLTVDLRSADEAKALVGRAWPETDGIDILVNSAGICHFHRLADVTAPVWDEILDVDLRALFFVAVAFGERVDAARGGRIINLGSNAGRKGRAVSAPYAAAKAAVANVTESLALAYGPKQVTANTLCPAVVLTPLWESSLPEVETLTGKTREQLVEGWRQSTPLRRLGTVDDVAGLALFLASDEAAFITGQEINVCGGFMLTC